MRRAQPLPADSVWSGPLLGASQPPPPLWREGLPVRTMWGGTMLPEATFHPGRNQGKAGMAQAQVPGSFSTCRLKADQTVAWQPVWEDEGFPAAGDIMTLDWNGPPLGPVQNGQGNRTSPSPPISGGLAQPTAQGPSTGTGQRGRELREGLGYQRRTRSTEKSQWGCQLLPQVLRPHSPLIPREDSNNT